MRNRSDISRREFFKWAGMSGAALSISQTFLPRLAEALTVEVAKHPLIWLQNATCTGCSVSVINSIHPAIKNILLDQVLPGHQLVLNYHATIMAASGDKSIEAMAKTAKGNKGRYILIVEGSIPTKEGGIFGSIGEKGGRPVTMAEWTRNLGRNALATIAIGTCAAYGGIPSALPNPTGCKGVPAFFEDEKIKTPVFTPYLEMEKNGVRYLFMSLIRDMDVSMIHGSLRNMTVLDPIETAKKILRKKKYGSDLVILLSHLGLLGDREIARVVQGIDIIIGSHSRSLLDEPVMEGKTMILHSGGKGRLLGELTIQRDEKGGFSFLNRFVRADVTLKNDPRVEAILQRYREDLIEMEKARGLPRE